MSRYTLSVLVENQPGVLSKVVALFSRRGFNIHSLAVGPAQDETVSCITIVVNGDEHTVEQVEKQLNKIIPVIKVRNLGLPGEHISSGLALIKVQCEPERIEGLMQLAKLSRQLVNIGSRVSRSFMVQPRIIRLTHISTLGLLITSSL